MLILNSYPYCDPGDEARLEKMKKELKAGFEFIKKFKEDRVITVFGSSKIKEGNPIYEEARKFGYLASKAGFTIVTGGGPGIMEAANRGALEAGGKSVGLCIEIPDLQEKANPYVKDKITFHYFFVRKVMLAHVAQAYVYFPGGFGTLDEFFEISNLVVTKKLHKDVPIVLVDQDYWLSLRSWLDRVLADRFKTLYEKSLRIWKIVDKAEEALEIIKEVPVYLPRHDCV